MRKALIAVAVVAMLVFAGAAMAAKTGQAKPWVYDPGKIGGGVAARSVAHLEASLSLGGIT